MARMMSPELQVTDPSFRRMRERERRTLVVGAISRVAPELIVNVPGVASTLAIVPSDHRACAPATIVMSAAPPSVPPSTSRSPISDSRARLVMFSVPPVMRREAALSRLAIDEEPAVYSTVSPAMSGMQTRSVDPGTPSGLQFAAACQELVPAPPSHVFVADT